MDAKLDRLVTEAEMLMCDLSKFSTRAKRSSLNPRDECAALMYAANRAWHELDDALRKIGGSE